MRTSSGLVFAPPSVLSAVMSRQHGVFSADQAYAAGFSPGEIHALVSRRQLAAVRRGVYVPRSAYDGLEPRARHVIQAAAAALVLKEPVLSHETAAVCTGLELLEPDLDTVHVTRPALRSSRREAGIHHHSGALPAGHLSTWTMAPVTSLARTAFDVAATNDFARGLAAVDSALRMGASASELRDTLEFCRSWPGSRPASRAIGAGDGRAANPGESYSRAQLIAAGLAPTDIQVEIFDGRGLVGRADTGWLPLRVLGEFDGKGKYGTDGTSAAEAVWAEKIREDRFRALGYEVVRWTYVDLHHPQAWLARVRAALARAQRGLTA